MTARHLKTWTLIPVCLLLGHPLNKARLYHADVAKGGHLVLQMGPKPDEKWGHATSPPPQP